MNLKFCWKKKNDFLKNAFDDVKAIIELSLKNEKKSLERCKNAHNAIANY